MELVGQEKDQRLLAERPAAVCAAFEGSEEIGAARDTARAFLTSVQACHGLAVLRQAMGTIQLVVSELVTNARKYAPGPCLLTLEIIDGAVEVTVWDSSSTLPSVLAPDPSRIGQHGPEIVIAVCRSFEMHREPVGKRLKAAVALTDEPGLDTTALG